RRRQAVRLLGVGVRIDEDTAERHGQIALFDDEDMSDEGAEGDEGGEVGEDGEGDEGDASPGA
ncbi:DNA polymerase IV, partial [Burkholderia pseudomallei]|nr:DNA polymerase IV [Burkholderia pseudomallei]MBF3913114.1 DNA polymerase IV [Burkholderia pseudomallei]